MQAMDQIINSAAKTLYMAGGKAGYPIVFRGQNGAPGKVSGALPMLAVLSFEVLKLWLHGLARGCEERPGRPEPSDDFGT